MGLEGKIETQRSRSGCGILLQRLEAEHERRVLAGRGRKPAYFESARIVGGSRDLAVRSAFSRYGSAGDGLPPGANNSGLDVGGGHSREYEQDQAS
jgi:hypothetical protein